MPDLISFLPAASRLDLVSESVADILATWTGPIPVDEVLVGEIDPDSAGGTDFCAKYGFKHTEGANCVIVEGHRGTTRTLAAVLIPVGYRSDLNGVVRRQLGARQVSLAPLELVLEETKMEYGSITPVGLPSSWPVLIDQVTAAAPRVVIGSGLRRSKLSLPGPALLQLPGAIAIEGLSRPPG